MEKKHVLISIKGLQTQLGETSDVELVTEGVFYKEDEKYYAVYDETEITGLLGTTTTLQIEGDHVALIRNGTVNNQMLFIPNQKTTSYYDTCYGSLVIGVLSDRVLVDMSDTGGTINIDYSLDINEEFGGNNQFRIQIKEA